MLLLPNLACVSLNMSVVNGNNGKDLIKIFKLAE